MEDEVEKEVETIVNDLIKDDNLQVSAIFKEKKEGKYVLNIELDSEGVIDLNRITDASRIINEELDKTDLLKDIDELDIYSKEKGGQNER